MHNETNQSNQHLCELLMNILLTFGDTPFTEQQFKEAFGYTIMGLGIWGNHYVDDVTGSSSRRGGLYVTEKGKRYIKEYKHE